MVSKPLPVMDGVVLIASSKAINEMADLVSKALKILPFEIDVSGKYEEVEVWISQTFGLEIGLCRPPDVGNKYFELSVLLDQDAINYDIWSGPELKVEMSQFLLMQLQNANLGEVVVKD